MPAIFHTVGSLENNIPTQSPSAIIRLSDRNSVEWGSLNLLKVVAILMPLIKHLYNCLIMEDLKEMYF